MMEAIVPSGHASGLSKITGTGLESRHRKGMVDIMCIEMSKSTSGEMS